MTLTSRKRDLHRRQRRVNKLRELKAKLKATTDLKTRQKLIARMQRISPGVSLPE